jgi:hypothetical protein
VAHYARVNSDNIVTYVTPIPNSMITDENGTEHEDRAIDHLNATVPTSDGDRWIQTSYNNNLLNQNLSSLGPLIRELSLGIHQFQCQK